MAGYACHYCQATPISVCRTRYCASAMRRATPAGSGTRSITRIGGFVHAAAQPQHVLEPSPDE